jgi:hypothetical protein
VEDLLANIDPDRGEGRCGRIHGLLLQCDAEQSRTAPRGKQPVHPISGH